MAQKVGTEKFEAVLGEFFKAHVHKTAKLASLLQMVHAKTGFDPLPLAEKFLRKKGFSG